MREFAEAELQLPADRQYVSYRDLGRDYVAWAVYAAPEFSLEAKRWWYPFVGRLKYRGWFSLRDATARAERLSKRGFDVAVAGVPAYSTLGWLRDPVLNTFVYLPDTELAELLFHELTHQKRFIRGDTDFNEAFATATAREGVRRWLRAQAREHDLRDYEARLERERTFVAHVRRTRQELKALYETGRSLSPDTLRRQKAAAFQELQQRGRASEDGRLQSEAPAAWLSQPLNNAWLNTISTYLDLVPAFDRLLAENGGDLERYFDAVEKLGGLDRNARKAELERLGGRIIADEN
jgi:predicted aminopeptidase